MNVSEGELRSGDGSFIAIPRGLYDGPQQGHEGEKRPDCQLCIGKIGYDVRSVSCADILPTGNTATSSGADSARTNAFQADYNMSGG